MSGVTDREPVVSLKDVRKEYQLGGTVTALDDVGLELPSGSYTAVMGPSGSGKSTLLNLVGALDTPTDGDVVVAGENVATLSESGRARLRGDRIGFIFQTFNLMSRLTAAENVTLPLMFAGWGRKQRRERAQTILEEVGLGDRLEHLPRELSGGQRQRVAIARALASDPELILADEPTGNLDTETGNGIMQLLEAANDRGNAILLVTHERRIAEHADRIVHVKDGVIEEIETAPVEQ
ncbi:ABC transporter ATP-binding protein [Natrarchaeobaculum sulfurireducens]|uniref:ABC-type antimicrobial peptide transport system, ATPase component n=1 Tax=Natrarchaeobaculum sulfurireducens TaxID=2044521 RepID=A0A346PK27_9EURY|nr:ABC transporter ATP-binding protein [Natrarchaeobaculum sulfurireducens]AXR79872.1 ABC-type antimicrobial peptide transport system, ATPase component [Natrarchaeobaculum sulfurireducens]